MLSRRRFLIASGIAAAAPVATCRPNDRSGFCVDNSFSPLDASASGYLRKRRAFLRENDPRVFLGYPGNRRLLPEGFLKWRRHLNEVELGLRPNNNAGDPFRTREVYASHYLEADLIERFARRFGFPSGNVWGFVTNSGTDSNLHGLYVGRTVLRERTGVMPKIYFTEDAHYSVQIIADLLGLSAVAVLSRENGTMDTGDLGAKLARNTAAPALVLATIGTTFKGAIDDLDQIREQLKGREAYVHADAALFGGYLPASAFSATVQQAGPSGARFDSIAVSCHKFFGYCAPAGLFVTTKEKFEEFRGYFSKVHDPAYISHVPGTITCSRDAVKPAEFHYFSTDEAFSEQQRDAREMLRHTEYLYSEMRSHFASLGPKRFDQRSNIIHFRNAFDQKLTHKWVLATMRGPEPGAGSLAHVVIMPHVDRSLLDEFLSDLQRYVA